MISANKTALKAAAAVGMIIGLIGMAIGWTLLFTTGSNGIALGGEMGGVAICLGAYLLWHKANKPQQSPGGEGQH